jgi:hypothetical protein
MRMPNFQPFLSNQTGTRRFACSAVALQAIVMDPEERTLLLSSPTRHPGGAWQVVSGALVEVRSIQVTTCRAVNARFCK